MSRYQFKFQLPKDSEGISKLIKVTSEKVLSSNNEEVVKLTLAEGVASYYLTGKNRIEINIKLAYPPGKQSPAYVSCGCSFLFDGKTIFFPHDQIEPSKINMYFEDSPKVINLNPSHIDDEFYSRHAPFLDEHKEGRYKGSAFERASMILDFIGHLMTLEIQFSVNTYGSIAEFYKWLFDSTDINEEIFLSQIEGEVRNITWDKCILPYIKSLCPSSDPTILIISLCNKAAKLKPFPQVEAMDQLIENVKQTWDKVDNPLGELANNTFNLCCWNLMASKWLQNMMIINDSLPTSEETIAAEILKIELSEAELETLKQKIEAWYCSEEVMAHMRGTLMVEHHQRMLSGVIDLMMDQEFFKTYKLHHKEVFKLLTETMPNEILNITSRNFPIKKAA